MEHTESKPLSTFIFIPLLSIIFIRPFLSGLAYPAFELYYKNLIISLAIITMLFYRNRSLRNAYNLPILMLLLAYIISSMSSVNIQNSIEEVIKLISYISIFFIVSMTDDKQKKNIVKIMVAAALIISLYSIYQYFWGYQHTLDFLKETNNDFLLSSSYAKDILIAKRAIGTFPSPNILGSYLIMLFFLAIHLRQKKPRLSLGLWIGFLIAAALILTKSLGAWLSLGLTLIIFLILQYKPTKKQKLTIAISFTCIALIMAFILASRWDRLVDLDNPQSSIVQRLNYWHTALAMIKDHPILGIGPGNFQEVFLAYKAGPGTDTRYAHNIFLHTWSEAGILGFLSICCLIVIFLKKLLTKPENSFIIMGGFVFLLHNLIDNSFFIPQAGMLWWILLSL